MDGVGEQVDQREDLEDLKTHVSGDATYGLRLLCLDGGGVRGLSSLLILRRLMYLIQSEDELENLPKPCDVFDMIAGTSTGALIAIMLGRLRMDVQTCIEAYRKLAGTVFETKFKNNTLQSLFKKYSQATVKPMFDSAVLEREIQKIVEENCDGGADAAFFEPNGKCKVLVLSTQKADAQNARLRSYRHPEHEKTDMPIWEIGRASSAAPTFFSPQRSKTDSTTYLDGGLGFNNPIFELFDEASEVCKFQPIRCLVSIGTGMPGVKGVGDNLKGLIDTLQSIVTETEKKHRLFLDTHPREIPRYYRFNVDRGMGDILLDEHKRLGEISQLTNTYLDNNPHTTASLRGCATKLRRQRPIFVPPSSFRRTMEMTDQECYLGDYFHRGWDPSLAVDALPLNPGSAHVWRPEYIYEDVSARSILLVRPKWFCQSGDGQVNLRCVLHNVLEGSYRVVWRFVYTSNTSRSWTFSDQATLRFHAGFPVNERQFLGRTEDANVPWISNNMDDIIMPRLTYLLKYPFLPGNPQRTIDGSWAQGARMFAPGMLEVDSRRTVALMVRRLKGEPGLSGHLVFLGAELVS